MPSTVSDLFEFDLKPGPVARRLGWSGFGMIAARAKGLVTLPLALWILGADDYGTVTVALTTAAALAPLVLLNVPDGAGRLVVSAPSSAIAAARISKIRRMATLVGLGVAVVGVTAGALAGSTVVGWSGVVAATAILFKVGTLHMEYFQQTARLVRMQLLSEYLAVGVGLGLATWLGADGMLAAQSAIVGLIGLRAWRTLHVPRSAEADDEPGFWPAALRLSLPLLPVAFAQWALFSIDSILIYSILEDSDAGAYSASYSIGSVALFLPLAINAVWFPTSQRLLARSRAELRRYTARGALILTGLAVPLVALATLAAPLLLLLFDDPVYDPIPSCVPWIAGGFALLAFAKLMEGVLYADAKPFPILACYVIGAVVNIVLNLVLIPAEGIEGAAWATAAGYGATALLLFAWALASLRDVTYGGGA